TENKIKRILEEAGVTISGGEISNILTQEEKEELTREREEILKAGLESSSYFHTDDTGLKHKEKKEELLLVLRFPEIPLHNNPAELALREPVVKRKISNGTRSEDGKAAWENMMSILDTSRKQGVGFFDYVKDIYSGKRALTRLGHLISQKASIESTFY
ncbi:MAG: transposase, partial [Halobacteriota archaeon]